MKTAIQLRKFRQTCERSAGIPASEIYVPLLAVLTDICTLLKLSPKDRQYILGRKGVIALKHTRKTRVQLAKPVIYPSRSEQGRP